MVIISYITKYYILYYNFTVYGEFLIYKNDGFGIEMQFSKLQVGRYLLCSFWFMPQMTGGAIPPGLETENESTRHSLAVDTSVGAGVPITAGVRVPPTSVPITA